MLALVLDNWQAVVGAIGAIGALLTGWMLKRAGRKEAERDALETAYEAEQTRRDVDHDVALGDARERLRRRWSGDGVRRVEADHADGD